MSKSRIIVVSAPSGCGKSTLIGELLKRRDNIKFSVSATTRQPRQGEIDGVHYFFVTREKFMKMAENGEFLEHAIYVENCYGTPAANVEENLKAGFDVIMDIDVKGALQVREKRPDAILIFLKPPSFEELEKRLVLRGKDSMEVIARRMETARWECSMSDKFDHVIVNDDIDRAVNEFISIIEKEKNN